MNKKISIGLDIGTTSVGWSVIEIKEDDKFDIIKQGVRLFDDVASPKDGTLQNKVRGESRRRRRTIRRMQLRKKDARKLFIQYKLANDEKELNTLLDKIDITKLLDKDSKKYQIVPQIILDGLKEKFVDEQRNQKILVCLFYFIQHRGYTFLTEEELEKLKDSEDSRTPSQIVVDFYNHNGWYKGNECNKNPFQKVEEELKEFCKVQELEDEFVKRFLSIFKRVRNFDDGPGSDKSPTIWGKYRRNKDGIVEQIANHLWETTLGTCSFYSNIKESFLENKFSDLNELSLETKSYFFNKDVKNNSKPNIFRAAKNAPISEVFNLFNDISNIKINQEKLNKEQVEKLLESINKEFIQKITKDDKTFGYNFKTLFEQLKDILNLKELQVEDLSGLRVKVTKDSKKETKNENIITSLDNYYLISRFLYKQNNELINNLNIFDINFIIKCSKIFDLYWKNNGDKNKIFNSLKEEITITMDDLPKLVRISDTHSLCAKAMYDYIKYFNKESNLENWSYFSINEQKKLKDKNELKSIVDNTNGKYIPKNILEEAIVSPTTKRAFNQTIKVINAILKEFVYKQNNKLSKITLELARDKNSSEEQKNIKSLNTNNAKIKKEIEDKFGKDSKLSILKYRLWKEQDEECIYSGKTISEDEIYKCEIDHIFPYSIVNDDSYNNKVLVFSDENQYKGNKTPYQYIKQKGDKALEEYINRVDNNTKISKDKKQRLKYDSDIISNVDFVARQLNDTRYASRLVLNKLQNFFSNNENFTKDNKVIVNVVRGSLTSYFRKNCYKNDEKLLKDRDDFRHHAIDASIIAFLGNNSKLTKNMSFAEMMINSWNKNKYDIFDNKVVNKETGEVVFEEYDFTKNKEAKYFFDQLLRLNSEDNDETLFSRMLVNKKTTQIGNQTVTTLSKIKENNQERYYEVKKLNIMDLDLDKLKPYFDKTHKDHSKLLCKNDKLYQTLKNIFSQYNDNKSNPFQKYMQSVNNIEDNKKTKFNFLEIKEENIKLKSLKYLGGKKELDFKEDGKITNYLELNKWDYKSKNKKIIVDSLECLETRIYKNRKGSYVAIPINSLVLTQSKLDREKLNIILEKENIDPKEYNNFRVIKKGTIVMLTKDCEMRGIPFKTGTIFYMLGSSTDGKVEMKHISRVFYNINNKNSKAKKRFIPSINVFIKNFKILKNLNFLGINKK